MDEGTPNANVQAVENAANNGANEVVITSTKSTLDGALSKKRKVTVEDLLMKCVATPTKPSAAPNVDELEEYLSAPIAGTEIKLLQFWKNNEGRWPKLAKMAKQYLAAARARLHCR